MTQEVVYTDSAIVDKIVEHFTKYKQSGSSGEYFYNLFYYNFSHKQVAQIPLQTLEPVWNFLPAKKHMFKRLMSQAIIKFLKTQRPAYIINGFIDEERIRWEMV